MAVEIIEKNRHIVNDETREVNDLDSITIGSASCMQVKIYYNRRTDKEVDLMLDIDLAMRLAKHSKARMGEDYAAESKK